MATKIDREQLYELAVATLNDSLDWSECTANASILADEFAKYDMTTASAEVILKSVADKGLLARNEKLEAAFAEYFRRHPEYAGLVTNREFLKKVFLYKHTGKYNGTPITADAMETHGKFLAENGTLAKNQQAVEAERTLRQDVAAATRESQEQVRMVKELLAPWEAKISKNPYVVTEGQIRQRDYDLKEEAFYRMPIDQLKVLYDETMQKRALRNLGNTDIAALKLKVRADYEKQNKPIERFAELPREIRLEGRVTPLNKETILYVQKYNRSVWAYWVERFGLNQLQVRLGEEL